MFPIGGGRRVRMGRFGVALNLRLTGVRGALPQDLARLAIDAIDVEALRRFVFDGLDIPVQSNLQRRLALGWNGAGNENLVAPNNRARMRESWNLGLPQNVLARFARPFRGRISSADSARGGSAELRPVGRREEC